MFNVEELNEDLLVQEGHYQERIQNEALEEAYVHHTCMDFIALIREYGAPYILSLLDASTRNAIYDEVLGYVDGDHH